MSDSTEETKNNKEKKGPEDQGKPQSTETEALQEENSKLKNEYLYLRAEFDNFRKNSIKERSDLIKFGPERMAIDLLNVVDIFEKALATEVNPENLEGIVSGFELTYKELKNSLEKFGVIAVDSELHAFDPTLHEALGSEESETLEAGTITQVFKKPYKFHDKIIRHGQVIIAKESTKPVESD